MIVNKKNHAENMKLNKAESTVIDSPEKFGKLLLCF